MISHEEEDGQERDRLSASLLATVILRRGVVPQEESNLLYRPSHCPTCGVKITGGRPGDPMRALPCECPISSLTVVYLDAGKVSESHPLKALIDRHSSTQGKDGTDELTAEELRDPVIAALHHAWNSALDTTNSPDFRETHERCGECDQATGQLKEDEYLRLQGRRIRRAAEDLRRERDETGRFVETWEEWRVDGQMYGEAEPYQFTWSQERQPGCTDPEAGARQFLAASNRNGLRWDDGPHLSMRKVTRTTWQTVEANRG